MLIFWSHIKNTIKLNFDFAQESHWDFKLVKDYFQLRFLYLLIWNLNVIPEQNQNSI